MTERAGTVNSVIEGRERRKKQNDLSYTPAVQQTTETNYVSVPNVKICRFKLLSLVQVLFPFMENFVIQRWTLYMKDMKKWTAHDHERKSNVVCVRNRYHIFNSITLILSPVETVTFVCWGLGWFVNILHKWKTEIFKQKRHRDRETEGNQIRRWCERWRDREDQLRSRQN